MLQYVSSVFFSGLSLTKSFTTWLISSQRTWRWFCIFCKLPLQERDETIENGGLGPQLHFRMQLSLSAQTFAKLCCYIWRLFKAMSLLLFNSFLLKETDISLSWCFPKKVTRDRIPESWRVVELQYRPFLQQNCLIPHSLGTTCTFKNSSPISQASWNLLILTSKIPHSFCSY